MSQYKPLECFARLISLFPLVNDLRQQAGLQPYKSPEYLRKALTNHNVQKTIKGKIVYYDIESSLQAAQRAISRGRYLPAKESTSGDYEQEIKRYETESYVSIRKLYEIDKQLRKRYCIHQRANYTSFKTTVNHKKIRSIRTPGGHYLYDVEHYIDIYSEVYEKNGDRCSLITDSSIEKAHMIATKEILKDPNYKPKTEAAKAAGINKERIGQWVKSLKILPYFDNERKILLYPIDKLRELGEWRPMRYLRKHLSAQECENIRAKRRRQAVYAYNNVMLFLYYVPELSHL